MVQLSATAAIEYVAACCRTRTRTITKIVRGAYARSLQVQCLYAPSRLSVPSIVAWRTNKQTNKQNDKKTDKLGLLAPRGVDPLPKFSGYVEVDAHYIFHRSTIWVRPLCTELGPKTPPKCRFCHEAKAYMSPSGDINNLICIAPACRMTSEALADSSSRATECLTEK